MFNAKLHKKAVQQDWQIPCWYYFSSFTKYRKLYIINQTTIHNFLDLPIDRGVYILVVISASVWFGIHTQMTCPKVIEFIFLCLFTVTGLTLA